MSAALSPEFSPEQHIVIEVLRFTGTPNPENVVRADRLTAYLADAYLAPVLARMAQAGAAAIEAFQRSSGGAK